MLKHRLVACLVHCNGVIVQSINFKRYLPVGNVKTAVEFVAKWDVDEIVLLDINATNEGRKPNLALVAEVSTRCFVPLTVGGGIHDVAEIRQILRNGADKICVNSEALRNPRFVTESARIYGSQCVVVSIDARMNTDGQHEVYADGGRRATGLDPVRWAREMERRGAGEIFLNSIDRDGSKHGYDLQLIRSVAEAVKVPVVACGGVGVMGHFVEGVREGKASAVAAANIFHYIEHSTIIAKAHLLHGGVDVRLNTAATYKSFSFDTSGRIQKKSDSELGQVWFEKHVFEQ